MTVEPDVGRSLGEVLLAEGLVAPEDMELATAEADATGKSLGRILVDRGALAESSLVATLAKRLGMDYVELADRLIDPTVAALVPESLARRHTLMPVEITDDGELTIAMGDPANVVAIDDVRRVTGRKIRVAVSARADILAAIDRFMRSDMDAGDLAQGLHTRDDHDELDTLGAIVEAAPIVKFVNALIEQAVRDRASDIHIEPQETDVRVRYRVDGVLHEVMRQHRRIHAAVVSRLKIMADLDIAERRIPQDGRISVRAGGKAIDLRVSTLPTVYGEKLVMRILDKTSILIELTDLGFSTENYARYEHSFRKPYGMILVTGPTGSGKSTTLYATLNVINRPEVNIVTTEDPVEYRLPGISQVQINPRAGLTFPSALRSILRQDPDIVLVGEMRDHDTAQIGMEAALTGHLVLSTLHTNDAPSAVTRLTEMKIDPFLVASSVDCVLAQRLARRLCGRCKQAHDPSAGELASAGFTSVQIDTAPTLYRAVGCGACAKTGYRGRTAIHEVMTVSEEIERLIVERASTDEISKFAIAQGMTTMREEGLVKVLAGETTLEEIARVIV